MTALTSPPTIAVSSDARCESMTRSNCDPSLADAPDPTAAADAALLRTVLDADRMPGGAGMPRLLVLAGLPGSGKSYVARRVVERAPFLVVETDRLRKALTGRPRYTRGENRRLFAACHLLVAQFLGCGFPVLFDATNLTHRSRQPLYRIAESLGVPLAVVEVTASKETVRRRLSAREAGLDTESNSDAGWLVYCRMVPAWEPISREHHTVDTSTDITPVLDQIGRWALGQSPAPAVHSEDGSISNRGC